MKDILNDSKSFYSYVRFKTRVKVGIGPLLDELGNPHGDDNKMSEILNNYFSTVFTNEDLATMPDIEYRINSYLPNKDVEILEDIDTIRIKVTTALGKLKENKSAGGMC